MARLPKPLATDRAAQFLRDIDDATYKRLQLAATFEEFIPILRETLKEMGQGIWYEEVTSDREGNVSRRVYRKEPNLRALQMIASYANLEPSEVAQAFLMTARAQANIIQQRTMLQQARLNDALEAKTRREIAAMDKSYVTEEDYEKAIIKLVTKMIGCIQAIHPDKFPGGEDGKQDLIDNVRVLLERELEELMSSGDGEDEEEES